MAFIYCGISAVSFCALFFVPETPHWLVTFRDDPSGAAKSLKWTYPEQGIFETQYELFMESHQTSKDPNSKKQLQQTRFSSNSRINKLRNYMATYKDPIIYKPLIILFLLFIFQQLSGAYVIIFYAVDLFRKIGGEFQKSIDAFRALVLLGSFRFVMSIISTVLAKKIGRRTLLMTSGIGMSVTSLIAGLYMYLTIERGQLAKLHIKDQQEDNVALICVLGYVCFSAIGFLIIPWTLIGELLPVKVRGVLGGFLVAMAYVFMFGLVKVFPYLLQSLKVQVIFFGMSVLNFLAVCFIFFFIPETFGKTFAEIEKYFKTT
ncbi:membrane transporter [Oryctes borbonicus]|uniref:Membrane transporter n=1 Tax=Oryctes borbonicus TaxID=1629725 RepID=A0A0T6BEE9_9SCAR|nr:membrane transporter [Oryctes borbonicus]